MQPTTGHIALQRPITMTAANYRGAAAQRRLHAAFVAHRQARRHRRRAGVRYRNGSITAGVLRWCVSCQLMAQHGQAWRLHVGQRAADTAVRPTARCMLRTILSGWTAFFFFGFWLAQLLLGPPRPRISRCFQICAQNWQQPSGTKVVAVQSWGPGPIK